MLAQTKEEKTQKLEAIAYFCVLQLFYFLVYGSLAVTVFSYLFTECIPHTDSIGYYDDL